MIKLSKLAPISELPYFQDENSPQKNIKISNNRLPADFFGKIKMRSCNSSAKGSGRRQFSKQLNRIPLKISTTSRQNKTSIEMRHHDEDLILGVLTSTKQIKKVFRRHSIEIKKEKKLKQYQIDSLLPPLMMKKGKSNPL